MKKIVFLNKQKNHKTFTISIYKNLQTLLENLQIQLKKLTNPNQKNLQIQFKKKKNNMTTSIAFYTSIATDAPHYVYKEQITNIYRSKNSYISKSVDSNVSPTYQLVAQNDVKMRAPFGVAKPFDPEKQPENPNRKSVELTIESQSLLEQLQALDSHNLKVANENCVKWFGKKLGEETIMEKYIPLVKEGKDENKGKYKPTLKVRFNTDRNSYNYTKFFEIVADAQGKQIPVEKTWEILKQHSSVVPIIRVSGLWFSQNFGMSIEATDMIVFPPETRKEFPFQWEGVVSSESSSSSSGSTSSSTNGMDQSSTHPKGNVFDSQTQPHGSETNTIPASKTTSSNTYIPPTDPVHI